MFVDEYILCKDCVVFFGEMCLECSSSLRCDTCASGYFFVGVDDETRGIVAANEIFCRPCQDFFGEFCSECNQVACLVSSNIAEQFIDVETG